MRLPRVRGKHRSTGEISPSTSCLQRRYFPVSVPYSAIIRGMDAEPVKKTADMSQYPTIKETNISAKCEINVSF